MFYFHGSAIFQAVREEMKINEDDDVKQICLRCRFTPIYDLLSVQPRPPASITAVSEMGSHLYRFSFHSHANIGVKVSHERQSLNVTRMKWHRGVWQFHYSCSRATHVHRSGGAGVWWQGCVIDASASPWEVMAALTAGQRVHMCECSPSQLFWQYQINTQSQRVFFCPLLLFGVERPGRGRLADRTTRTGQC